MNGKSSTRTLVIGDIHGAHIPLQQCLDRCGFDYENDLLITLGDICDGWPYVYECVEILLKCKNRIDITGNHDDWFSSWLIRGRHPDNWRQGGKGTMDSYIRAYRGYITQSDYGMWERNDDGIPVRRIVGFNPDWIPSTHIDFFNQQQLYYKDAQNRLFVHGGFIKELTLEENEARIHDDDYFYWNRELWDQALSVSPDQQLKFIEEFKEIFIGHTQTTNWTKFKKAPNSYVLIPTQNDDCPPMHADIIWNLDTGAGSNGKLTIMDVDTHEYWQSDQVNEIYGVYKPRG